MTDKPNELGIVDLIIKAREEAIERGIQANSIVISDKLRYVKSFRFIEKFFDGGISMTTFKPMICGMEIDIKNLPANLDFVVYEADEMFNEKLKEQIRKDTAKEILNEIAIFLNKQSESVNSIDIIPKSCKKCYGGSQTNRHNFLKELARKYGVEVDE